MATNPISPTERQLRIIQVLCWIPGFSLLLASCLEARKFYFGMMIIPMSLSSFHGIGRLINRSKPHGLVDLAFAFVIMAMLVPYWIVMADRIGFWGSSGSRVGSLVAFGSMPLIVNFCIHSYLALRALFTNPRAFFTSLFTCPTCPHCQREIRPSAASRIDPRLLWDLSPHGSSEHSRDEHEHARETKKVGYSAVPTAEAETDLVGIGEAEAEVEGQLTPKGRPSTDDESAPLV